MNIWQHIASALATAGKDVAKVALPVAEVVGPTAAEALLPGPPGQMIGESLTALVSAAENKFQPTVAADGVASKTGPLKLDWVKMGWPFAEALLAARGIHVSLTGDQVEAIVTDIVNGINSFKDAYKTIEAALAANKAPAAKVG